MLTFKLYDVFEGSIRVSTWQKKKKNDYWLFTLIQLPILWTSFQKEPDNNISTTIIYLDASEGKKFLLKILCSPSSKMTEQGIPHHQPAEV